MAVFRLTAGPVHGELTGSSGYRSLVLCPRTRSLTSSCRDEGSVGESSRGLAEILRFRCGEWVTAEVLRYVRDSANAVVANVSGRRSWFPVVDAFRTLAKNTGLFRNVRSGRKFFNYRVLRQRHLRSSRNWAARRGHVSNFTGRPRSFVEPLRQLES